MMVLFLKIWAIYSLIAILIGLIIDFGPYQFEVKGYNIASIIFIPIFLLVPYFIWFVL